jgi:hypothetical protein
MGRKLAWNIHVAGISQPDVQADAVRFIKGTSRYGKSSGMPQSKDTPHGLRVYGRWQDSAGTVRGYGGWVPDGVARSIAAEEEPEIPLVARLRWMFRPRPGKGPSLRMDIWTKRRSRKKS